MRKVMNSVSAAVALATASIATNASAAGLAAMQTEVSTVQSTLFTTVGVLAGIYLLYVGILAFTEKKTWSDFGWAIIHIAVVGAALTAASWAWTLLA